MATTINCIRTCGWAKVLLLLWFVQLAAGEPNAACKTMPSPGKDNDEQCCEMPEMFPNETMQQCMTDFERSSASQLQKSCQFSACVLKKQNLVKSDGKLDTEQIKTYIKDKIKASDEWKGLVEKAVLEDCLPMIEKDSATVKQMKSSLGDCEPVSALTIACAAAKLFGNCPSKDWTGSPVCDEWKTFLTKCSGSMDDLNAIYMLIESQKLT
ncbi:general odorant-binding protein 66-like [Anopheles maculipalpis]|uniref:general odorant-binding protein 66-like n=1 Tax=Anopheles maculipalpis TaxID=1496333 RepID=UPI002158CC84|nr:general odorant-binding protein 66-like [Anopheles maculipalpis]